MSLETTFNAFNDSKLQKNTYIYGDLHNIATAAFQESYLDFGTAQL